MNKHLKNILLYIRLLIDQIIDLVFSLYWDGKKENVPDVDKKYWFLAESAVSLAKMIRNRQLSSEEVVTAYVDRIKQVNPIINAIAEERFEDAIQEAKNVDKLIQAGLAGLSDEEFQRKPFLGVPFTTKEAQSIKGMYYTMGLWSRRRLRASEDGDAVAKMKNSGAILLATTNVPELLIWQETRNMVYGMTKNPHHTGRSPGGSSGAEAALTATCATPISLCSDIGGSTRMPAFYCGMFGYHPTPGVVNCHGTFFRKGGEESMLSLGFISRNTEDFIPLTKVLTVGRPDLLKLDRKVDLKKIKFYYVESCNDSLLSPITDEIKNAMTRVITKISQDFSTPKPYYHEGFNQMYKIWAYMMTKEPDDFSTLFHDKKYRANWAVELIRKLLGQSNHCLSAVMFLTEQQNLHLFYDLKNAPELLNSLRDDLFKTLGDDGVLIFPSSPHVAPHHYSSFLRPYNFSYWAILNTLMCPVVQVPVGRDSHTGMPLGLQVAAAPYQDALPLAIADHLNRTLSSAVLPCQIPK